MIFNSQGLSPFLQAAHLFSHPGLGSRDGRCGSAPADPDSDRQVIARLDLDYQNAVKAGDTGRMGEIMGHDFVHMAFGEIGTRDEILSSAERAATIYDQNDYVDGSRTIFLYGDTAIVAAQLLTKGAKGDARFKRKRWFNNVYIRRPAGWKLTLGMFYA